MQTLSDKLHQSLVAKAPGAIMVTDAADLCVLEANQASADLAGYPVDELQMRTLLDLFPAAVHPELKKTVSGLMRRGGTTTWRGPLLNTAGGLMSVHLTASLLGEAAEGQLAVYLRDESEGRRVEAELRAQNDDLVKTLATRTSDLVRANADLQRSVSTANDNAREAHRAAEAKSRFVATLTHELRTPLNALIGMSELLLDMELGEEQRETADTVLESAKGLMLLVNDVLDFAKIEAGRMELRREPFRLSDTLANLEDIFAAQFADKGLALCHELDPTVPDWLVGDEQRLRQVLVNLVGNAMKFTCEGGATVAVHAEPVGDSEVKVYLNVTDTGCGIAPADQKQLFDAYSQVDNPSQRGATGTGLGLSISRQLVELMGGRFKVVSALGKGSTFGFNLTLPLGNDPQPVESTPAEIAAQPEDSAYNSRRKALHVLVAEDNRVNQMVALGMLRKSGFTGVAVENGREALEALATTEFDMVFMDLQMPELGGLEATRAIRTGAAGDQNTEIPIIAMTGHATSQDRRACFEAGMNGYVTKPISSERILEAITGLAKPIPQDMDRTAPCNVTQLLEQMNDDRELANEILAIFCDDTAERLVKITEAVRNYDFNRVSDEAFAVESGAANICADKLVQLARDLQKSADHKEQEYAESLVDELEAELSRIPHEI